MREMSKVTVCLLGIGMIVFVMRDKALGGELGDISKTGAWQNTNFTHNTDYKFGESLISILKQNDIASITDLGKPSKKWGEGLIWKYLQVFSLFKGGIYIFSKSVPIIV